MTHTLLRAWRSCSLVVILGVFLPVAAHADPITPLYNVKFSWALSYGDLEFGPGPTPWGESLGYARSVAFLGDLDDALEGPNGFFSITGGSYTLLTGPLLNVTPPTWPGGDAVYTHAAGGSFSVGFDLLLSPGVIHEGTFQALLGAYIIAPDGPGGGGRTFGDLGPGLFDKGTAQLLGINRHTLSGVADFYLDTRNPPYPSPYRRAATFGYTYVTATEVPEPSLWWLMAMGIGAVAFRYRRRHTAA